MAVNPLVLVRRAPVLLRESLRLMRESALPFWCAHRFPCQCESDGAVRESASGSVRILGLSRCPGARIRPCGARFLFLCSNRFPTLCWVHERETLSLSLSLSLHKCDQAMNSGRVSGIVYVSRTNAVNYQTHKEASKQASRQAARQAGRQASKQASLWHVMQHAFFECSLMGSQNAFLGLSYMPLCRSLAACDNS